MSGLESRHTLEQVVTILVNESGKLVLLQLNQVINYFNKDRKDKLQEYKPTTVNTIIEQLARGLLLTEDDIKITVIL